MKTKLGLVFLFFPALLFADGTGSSSRQGPVAKRCMECHGEDDVSMAFDDGGELSIKVDTAALEASIHRDFDCTDCHLEYDPEGHDVPVFRDLPHYREKTPGICANCHEPEERLHDHMTALLADRSCIDCHGYHAVEKARNRFDCLACHGQPLELEAAEGSPSRLVKGAAACKESVHAELECRKCHQGYSNAKHPKPEKETPREKRVRLSGSCRECHPEIHEITRKNIHHEIMAKEGADTPVCIDCHGSHGMQSGRREKWLSVRRCEKCHEDVYGAYARSVHGRALVEEHNQDVPNCVDCHRAHEIADPGSPDFHLNTPGRCGGCHSDEALMASYGLPVSVMETYFDEFHGMTARFYEEEGSAEATGRDRIAVCTDCHGTHDIAAAQDDGGRMKGRLLDHCRKCHEDAVGNFPDAWLSHRRPDLNHAPLVFLVGAFYDFLIPFMIAGLLLHILLHLWRHTLGR